ncbi:hypothetical protein ACTMTI_38660 [Nonomuraea sp. H19]|uniref:hypothetical protein n=1 Tax=Nonomuraea sp. H19 TaxID=3452206 RepID=UPI003F8C44C2
MVDHDGTAAAGPTVIELWLWRVMRLSGMCASLPSSVPDPERPAPQEPTPT